MEARGGEVVASDVVLVDGDCEDDEVGISCVAVGEGECAGEEDEESVSGIVVVVLSLLGGEVVLDVVVSDEFVGEGPGELANEGWGCC